MRCPSNDEPVQEAFRYFGEIAHSPGYVWGDKTGALSMPWGDVPQGLFDEPPNCFMYRMGNFVTNFFPDDVVLGEDVDMFVLPGIDPEYGKPMLGSGGRVRHVEQYPRGQGADGPTWRPPQPTKFGRKGAGFCRRISR